MAHNWLLPHNILGDNTVTKCPAECPEHKHGTPSCKCMIELLDTVKDRAIEEVDMDPETEAEATSNTSIPPSYTHSYEYPYGKGNQGPGTGPDGERLI